MAFGGIKKWLEGIIGGQQQAPVQQAPQPMQPQPMQQFRMYEDNSFSGNPRAFMRSNPGYTFYEDNTFSQDFPQRPRYEDEMFVGSPRNLNQFSPMSADIRNFMPSGYEDGGYVQSQGMLSPINSDIRNYQMPDFRSLQQQTNPMGYTPGYNQEAYSNLQGGAPGFSSFGMQYPQGNYIDSRLRVR